ncbi:MAG: hypothetical protein CVU16_08190 [Betaproteobacteria bacterium HGW-Betaproteobacteria-10]|nr:MAG: hypothetical protein CVU16_08190 [Betaproteobacteria bacterium HGW-Betaproteobacteria-10]
MKRILLALAAVASLSTPAFAADVGVSVTIGQPGFYGQIDIGGFPRPSLIYAQPVMIERVPVGRPPIYLRVPPGHAKHWAKNCHKYNACGQRVYFVKDDWYNHEYVPRYQERRGDYQEHRGDDRGQYRDAERNDRRGNDHDRGRGRGRGHEH